MQHFVMIHLMQASLAINKDVGATLNALIHPVNWIHTANQQTKEPFAKRSNNWVSFHHYFINQSINISQIYLNWSTMGCHASAIFSSGHYVPYVDHYIWRTLLLSFCHCVHSIRSQLCSILLRYNIQIMW